MPAPTRYAATIGTRVPKLPLALLGAGAAVAVLAAAIANFRPNAGKLPEAAKMIESMQAVDVNARVLTINGSDWQHRVVVFVYPPDSPRVWVWDPATMSSEVEADINDPQSIAAAWFKHQRIDVQAVSAGFDAATTAPQDCKDSTPPADGC